GGGSARAPGAHGARGGVVEGAKGEPLAVGRRTRAVPPAIRRALRVRDGGCRFPGCDRSRFVHAHHIKHWADGGETALNNLVTLCSFHHRQVHEGGYAVHVDEGEIRFTRPDGDVIPPAGKLHRGCFRGNTCAKPGNTCAVTGAEQLKAFNRARGHTIDAQTARCRWRGERMDYDIAIDALCRCWELQGGLAKS
ncbi:MAG: HNH endonuclease signature motif containing protein, partial [Gammaproteobacteria bacterium]|nr:HNH endonuclease signature motif containing protein [Gammaproteobacteria bacterium]